MKCHYEVLEVPKDADESQIKSAYRKLALKWHPDKNLNNSEFAKEQFQLVQQAYEVLSDRQERAWYDNHRDQILHGSNSEYNDDSLDLFQYFTTTCFKGYGDDENGFYAVYRKVFYDITKEDIKHMDDKEEFCEIPSFGMSNGDYNKIVGPFYAYWMSYNTKKSYVWLDPYNIKETRDRKILKLIEKENKKVRQKAKKERNEEVRALVAFVRKRDKRVQERTKIMEAKILENRQKQEELSKQKRIERKKQLNESNGQAEWSKFDNVKTELEEIERSLAEEFGEQISAEEDDNMETELNNLYCVACNKVFKTEKAFQNHELSKKHKENIEKLKKTMLENELNSTSSEYDSNLESKSLDSDNNEDLSNSESLEVESKQRKKQKKTRNVIQAHLNENEMPSLDKQNSINKTDSNDSGDFDFGTSKRQKRKNKKTNAKVIKEKSINASLAADDLQDKTDESNSKLANEPNVAKQKLNKKTKDKQQNRKELDIQAKVDISHCCVTCKTDFPSKNKLFDHLKKTGHSVYLPQNNKLIKNKNKFVKEK